MRIVIDTNVVISGIFFGGNPRKILEAVVNGEYVACATADIISEYTEIVNLMLERKQGKINPVILSSLHASLKLIDGKSIIEICRDPDDNKFIECAVDSRAIYIVSGDKDLLDIKKYKDIKILTAKEFCDMYLK